MKKIYLKLLPFVFLLFSASSFSAIHIVTVADFSFTPGTMTVAVGDTIVWNWASGMHTTTSTSVPAGAQSWNAQINSGTPLFAYIVMVAGSYQYQCNFHVGMTASFTAVPSTGLPAIETISNLQLLNIQPSVYDVSYSLNHNSKVTLSLLDITGKKVVELVAGDQPAGVYRGVHYLTNLKKGIYIVELVAGNQRQTKRLILE